MEDLLDHDFEDLHSKLANSCKARKMALILAETLHKSPELKYSKHSLSQLLAAALRHFYSLEQAQCLEMVSKLYQRTSLLFTASFTLRAPDKVFNHENEWLDLRAVLTMMGVLYYLNIFGDHSVSGFVGFWVYLLKKLFWTRIQKKRKSQAEETRFRFVTDKFRAQKNHDIMVLEQDLGSLGMAQGNISLFFTLLIYLFFSLI